MVCARPCSPPGPIRPPSGPGWQGRAICLSCPSNLTEGPYRFDEKGRVFQRGATLLTPTIANDMLRCWSRACRLLFDSMVSTGRLDPAGFAQTEPKRGARDLYGLPRKEAVSAGI